MKRGILVLLLLAFACSKDKEVAKNNPLTAVRLIPGTGDNGGCVGLIAYNGYQDYICLDWEDENEFAEEYIVYYSEAEDGEYSEIARTTEKSYELQGLPFGQPYYFYVVPRNSTFGNGPKSEVYKTYISQKTNSTEFLGISEYFLTDFDTSNSRIYILGATLEIFDLASGNFVSSLTNPVFNSSNRIFVSSNDDIYLLDNQGKLISRFDIGTNQVINQLTSESIIDNVDMNRILNQIYLTKKNSLEVEVFNADLEPAFQFSLNPGFLETRIFAVGNDGKVYESFIDGLTEVGGKKHHLGVRTNEGMLLESYDFSPRSFIDQIEIDKEGNVYTAEIGLGSTAFIYKYKLNEGSLEFVGNFGDFNLSDDIFKFDYEDVIYRADLLRGEILYKIAAAE